MSIQHLETLLKFLVFPFLPPPSSACCLMVSHKIAARAPVITCTYKLHPGEEWGCLICYVSVSMPLLSQSLAKGFKWLRIHAMEQGWGPWSVRKDGHSKWEERCWSDPCWTASCAHWSQLAEQDSSRCYLLKSAVHSGGCSFPCCPVCPGIPIRVTCCHLGDVAASQTSLLPVFLSFEAGSPSVTQAGPEHLSSCLHRPGAGVAGEAATPPSRLTSCQALWRVPPRVFILSSSARPCFVLISFTRTRSCWIGATVRTAFKFHSLFKDPVPSCGHIRGCPGISACEFGGRQLSMAGATQKTCDRGINAASLQD